MAWGTARPAGSPETPMAPHRRSPARTGAATTASRSPRATWIGRPLWNTWAAASWPSRDDCSGKVLELSVSDHEPARCAVPESCSKRTSPAAAAPISRTASSQTRSNTDCGSSSRATAVATRRRAPCSLARRRFSASRPRSSCSAA